MRACVLIALAGCASGFTQTTSVGVAFGGGPSSLVVTFEVAVVAHETFEAPRDTMTATPQLSAPYRVDHHPRNYLGVEATAAGGMELSTAGLTRLVAAGLDYLPFLQPSGMSVGFGAQLGYAAGAQERLHVVTRLWFAVPVGRLAGAPLAIGVMLRVQAGLDSGTSGGPSLVISRSDF